MAVIAAPVGAADVDPDRDGVIAVAVDIKPGSDRNPVNVHSRGKLPIALLGSDALNVREVDPSTVLLRWAGISPADSPGLPPTDWSLEDVNRDGYVDMLLKYDMVAAQPFTLTDEATGALVMHLAGEFYDGTQIAGRDTVFIINNRNGRR